MAIIGIGSVTFSDSHITIAPRTSLAITMFLFGARQLPGGTLGSRFPNTAWSTFSSGTLMSPMRISARYEMASSGNSYRRARFQRLANIKQIIADGLRNVRQPKRQ